MEQVSLRKYFFSFVFLSFAIFNFCFADDVLISQYPDSPRAGDTVKLTLQSDKYDLSAATVTWTVDGQIVDSGVGRKTLDLVVSKNGIPQVVSVKVEQEGFNESIAQKVVEANTNFILYEGADSYVPSFYKGRALPAREGTARTALFSFKNGEIVGLNNENDNYTWKVNGEEKKDLSGQNKIVNNLIPKVTETALDVSVAKTDQNGKVEISTSKIPLQPTEVVVYRTDKDKLLKNVLGDTELGKQIYLLVEPFFFTATSKSDPDLEYTWKINGLTTKTPAPWAVVFSGKDQDTVKINLDLINTKKISQDASRGFTFIVK